MSEAHDYSTSSSLSKKKSTHSLSAYYHQGFKARVGLGGIFIVGAMGFLLTLCLFVMAFSYSPKGQTFIRSFKLRLFF